MLAIEVTIHVLPLIAIVLMAGAAGFFFRSSQLKSSRKKVFELEKEMLSNHAEILELQREKAELTKHLRQPNIPVITRAC
jgi:hypothetical protein